MAAILLEGRPVAEKLKSSLKSEVDRIRQRAGHAPKLVALQFGDNASSAVYVKAQAKCADTLGIAYELRTLPEATSQYAAEEVVSSLNLDKGVSAIIVQLPVPKAIDPKRLSAIIDPNKDAEGMHPLNLGRVLLGKYVIGPCTATAVMELLASAKVDLYGKEVVVVGHSEIVGKPLALMLLSKFATTTVCHIATGERGALQGHVKNAEVLVVAVGKAGLIKGDWIKDGAVVIDVGINRVGDKIVGDVEFEKASERASCITPVPGGVGPLTTAILMKNVVELAKAQV